IADLREPSGAAAPYPAAATRHFILTGSIAERLQAHLDARPHSILIPCGGRPSLRRGLRRELAMRIAIMGSGAVGGYFGARLANGASDVTFLARGAHLAAMREHGLAVESPLGDIRLQPVKATDDPKQIGSVDLVIVAVKLWDTEQAARQIEPLVRAGAAVVSLQNGVEKDEVLRRVLGAEPVMGGACYIGASIARPGVILHTGKMQRIVFGEYG